MIQIDATFLINLPERQDRRLQAMTDLGELGIPFYLWMATKDANGRKGLVITMRSLLRYCIENDYRSVLIFEDDINPVCKDLIEIVNECMEELPDDYDLCYFGCNMHVQPNRYSGHLLNSTGMYSTHATLYSRQAIEKIIPILDETTAYDITLVKEIQKDGRCFSSIPLLFSQRTGLSDITGKTENYERFIEKRFAEKTKDL